MTEQTTSVTPTFRVGDKVEWESQASGFTKRKVGTVLAIVPSGVSAAVKQFSALRTGRRGGGFGGLPRRGESYLVEVPGKSAKAKATLYWPRTRALRRVVVDA